MEPKIHKTRTADNGDVLNYRDINDNMFNSITDDIYVEDGEMGFVDKLQSREYIEDLRILSLKRAIDIAKLMSNVTDDDIINLAAKLVSFIRDTEI